MKDFFQNIGIATLAALAPIEAVLISVGVLIIADLITGIWAAMKRGEAITSAALRRTVSKMLIYQLVVITAFLLEKYLLASWLPVSKIAAGVIGLVEFKSIIENGDTIIGTNTLQMILKKLGSDNDTTKSDKDKK